MNTHFKTALLLAVTAALSGCVGDTSLQTGSPQAKTVTTGAAAGGASVNASEQLEYCDSALGTISLVENENSGWYTVLRDQYQLPPTAQLLRLMIQQSNCFVVVERGAAGMRAMERERALTGTGELREGSNMGVGQVVASDYSLQPEIVFSESNTGGLMGAIAGRKNSTLGSVLSNTQTRESSVLLLMVDNRSGVQISVAEGSASKIDWGGLASLFGRSLGGTFGAYNRTPQGKVIAAAMMDAYNQMVEALRHYQAQYVQGQGLGGGGRLPVDGGVTPSQTSAPGASAPAQAAQMPAADNGSGMLSLREAQQRLNRLGYDAGAENGTMDDKTRSALQTFQSDQGLPDTGRLDRATSQALRNQ